MTTSDDGRDADELELDRRIRAMLARMIDAAPRAEATPRATAVIADRGTPRRRSGPLAAVAAAMIVLLGAGGLLLLSRQSDPGEDERVDVPVAPSAATAPATTTAVTPESTGTSAPDPAAAEVTGLYRPTVMPDGYEVVELGVGEPLSRYEMTDFVRLDPNGLITARAGVWFTPPGSPDADQFEPNNTVRNGPAEVRRIPGDGQGSGQQIGIAWSQDDVIVSVATSGLSEPDAIQLAEELIVDTATGETDLPAASALDLQAIDDLQESVPGAVETVIAAVRLEQPSPALSARIEPNVFGQSLEAIVESSGPGWEQETLDGVEYYVQQFGDGGPTSVIRLDGQFVITVTGGVASDDIVEFALGLVPADVDAFVAAGTRLTDRAMELEVHDRIEFGNGVTATVRSVPSELAETGATAICVEVPIRQCRYNVGEAFLDGQYQPSVFGSFHYGHGSLIVGWQDPAEAARTGPARVVESPSPAPSTGTTISPVRASLVEQTNTPNGRFIQIDVPPGARPPEIEFSPTDGSQFIVSVELPDHPLDLS